MKLIAETAWHHEGDFSFMKDLVSKVCHESEAGFVKMHITLDLDEYMSQDHEAYDTLKTWLLSKGQWAELIEIVKTSGKGLMLLLNDTKAIEFSAQFKPEIIELHSVCLNIPRLQKAIFKSFSKDTEIVIGIGGCELDEVDLAVQAFREYQTVLMFGFQNYPTKYEDVSLGKIRKIQSLYSDKFFGYADHSGWDEPNNELITLFVAANNMSYVEKHVTTDFGIKRCDFSAAISIEMFNQLSKKLKIYDALVGDSSLKLNAGEESYSQYGPMKMAPIATVELLAGDTISESNVTFLRTGQRTDISQVEMLSFFGREITVNVKSGTVINKACF